ncbi:MAG TPA: hypothetical protein VNJ71_07510 [Gemmatimonadales bacterium]|jgi:hypothetical protein|nr:hypothetical protein [Gemmatimonadales bacterium]
MRAAFTPLALAVFLVAPAACRDYRSEPRLSDQAGLIPADQFARYGREQAIAVAIGREFARPYNSGPEKQAEVAMHYARTKFGADVVDITADPLGHRLVVTFKSGWRTAIVPIRDGKTGDETTIPS